MTIAYIPTSKWEIIIPEEKENLVANPSVENDTTGYTTQGGSSTITRVDTDSFWGAYSLECSVTTENHGFYYTNTDLVLTSGNTYKYSFYANVPADVNMIAYVATTAGLLVESFDFVGTGIWTRYDFTHVSPGSAQRRLYIITGDNNGADTVTWHTDGINFTQGAYLNTYIDGDQAGCEWNGAEHLSTSFRYSDYRLGGRIVNFADYGLSLKQQQGIGMAVPTHITQEYGNQDGALYQGTINKPRVFQLTTHIVASGLAHLHMRRDELIDALKINRTGLQQDLLLRYTGGNTTREIKAVYDAGMEFNATNEYHEVLPLRFIANDPYVYAEGESAAPITSAVTISGAFVAQRNRTGTWSHLSSTFNNQVRCVAWDEKHNLYYFGGSFSSPQSRVSKYDPDAGSFTFMGTGAADGQVNALWVDQITGDVYAGGSFSLMSSVARTKGIARWDYASQTWKAVASGILNGSVTAITQGNDRTVYIGGTFTLMSGISNTSRIARFNPTTNTVSAMGTGMDSDVKDLAISPDGYLYAIGYFTTSNGVTTSGIAKWTGSTFTAPTTGLSSSPDGESIGFGKDGNLYAGVFSNIQQGIDFIPYMAKWNGNQWLELSTGLDIYPFAIKRDKNGNIYVAGTITTAGGYALPSPIAIWNNSQWFPIGLKTSSGGFDSSLDLHIRNNGVVTIVFNQTNISLTEAITTVTNDGSADVYPRVVIIGPSSGTAVLYFIKNYTTGDTIYFNPALTVNANEKLTLDLPPNGKSFISNFQGNIFSKIVPGSNTGKFRLISGDNSISFFSNSTSLTIHMIWKDRYLSVDGNARIE